MDFILHLNASRVNVLFSRIIGYQIYRKNQKHAPPSNENCELYIVETCVHVSIRET